MCNKIDIYENDIPKNILDILLQDHTTQRNIFWATSNYEHLGKGYEFHSSILPELITGDNGHVIMPRVLKDKRLQTSRSKDMAEIFTPSWVCNEMNNIVDDYWLGRKGSFNEEFEIEKGVHTWVPNPEKIVFPEDKTWKDYAFCNRLEITCGEAPFLVSRYDTTTGEPIPLEKRIGLLDRKLRVVNENTESPEEWLDAVYCAFKSIYGYEWQGDNLLLARENLLYTFFDNYQQRFQVEPSENQMKTIAEIVSWNILQMDGLKYVVPQSCHDEMSTDLFGESKSKPCVGCAKNDIQKHNGTYCLIMNWAINEAIEFRTLLKKK